MEEIEEQKKGLNLQEFKIYAFLLKPVFASRPAGNHGTDCSPPIAKTRPSKVFFYAGYEGISLKRVVERRVWLKLMPARLIRTPLVPLPHVKLLRMH